MKIAFSILTEFVKYQSVYSLIKLINELKKKGHEVAGIFFFGSGVLNLLKKTHLGNSTQNIPEQLAALSKDGIGLHACQTWADIYGLFPDTIIDGGSIGGLGELSDMTDVSDKLIVFGARA